MNKAYKLVWSCTQQAWVVAGELAKGRKKSSGKALKLAVLLAGGLGAATAWALPATSELPSGESVVGNPVSFDRSVPNLLTVTQSNVAGIINWQSFNVGKDAKVVFNQPNASSYVFNNVYGGSVSEIYGQIQSNGHFVLNNPAGIIFGAGSQVNASAIVASAVNSSSTPYYSNHYSLNSPSGGTIQNDGSLTASAGSVTLLAGKIINSGSISATGGDVNVLNANAVDFADSVPTITTVSNLTGLIQNSGNITATQLSSVGGKILLTGDRSQAGSQIQLAGNLHAEQTLVNGLSILVNGVLNINGTSHSLDLSADNGYQLSSASAINLNGASSGFSVDGTAYTVVRDVNQLQDMSSNLSGKYVLATNIDASASTGWNSGAGFAPLGDSTTPFSGTLDGLGHAVNGLFINRGSTDNVGLFGYAQNATLQNIGLSNVSMTGANNVGSLAGHTAGSSISNSYATGNIAGLYNLGGLIGANGTSSMSGSYAAVNVTGGNKDYVGGLVGENRSSTISNSYATGNVSNGGNLTGGLVGFNVTSGGVTATISNSYATGSVTGNYYVGGLVGQDTGGSVNNSYATGSLTATGEVGGLVGRTYNSSISNSYWDADTTGQTAAVGNNLLGAAPTNVSAVYGNSSTSPSAYAQASYADLDFTNTWFIAQGFSRPMLRAFLNTLDVSGKVGVGSLYQLQGMSGDLAGNYYLTQDIDATATAASVAAGNVANYADAWGGRGFAPVGHSATRFTGQFDGNGYVIDGLSIKRGSNDNIGLFGFADGSTLHDVGLTSLNVTGRDYTGGLVGYFRSTAALGNALIENAYVSGQVTGSNNVGGLGGIVVTLTNGTQEVKVANSYSTVNVTATSRAGSLLGFFGSNFTDATALLENSYATGNVSASGYAGGLVGRVYNQINTGNSTIVQNSYASGAVTGSSNVGGLVGNAFNPTVSLLNNYWNSESSGQANGVGSNQNAAVVSNVVGLTNAQSKQLASYANWGSSIDAQGGTGATWRIYEGQTAPLLRSFLTSLTITANDDTKTYNAAAYTPAGGYQVSLNPVDTSNILGTASYGGSAVGAVNAGSYNLSLSGLYSSQQGYDISFADGTVTINKATLNISASNASRTYDGTTAANASAVISDGTLFGTDSISGGSFAFTDKNAGTGKHVTVSGVTVNDGNNGGNYDVTYVDNTTSTINKRLLTISAVADSKEYDGFSSSAGKPVVVGRQRGDSIAGLTQSFANKNAGTGKTINVDAGYSIRDGNGGNNYTVVLVNSTAGVITPKALTISTVANTKIYDGGVTSASKPLVTGLAYGDRVTGLFQQYETKTVGTGKKLLVKSGYVVNDGNGGNNYSITEQGSMDGVISAH